MRALLLAAPIIVTIFALIDLLLNGSPDRLRGIPKVAWFFLIALIQPAIGALVWLFAGYVLPRIEAERRGTPPSSPRPTYGGQLAPDDDPDFLFRLKREEWRRRREQERRQRDGGPATPPESGPAEPSGPPADDEPQP